MGKNRRLLSLERLKWFAGEQLLKYFTACLQILPAVDCSDNRKRTISASRTSHLPPHQMDLTEENGAVSREGRRGSDRDAINEILLNTELSIEKKFDLLKTNMSGEELDEIEECFEKGMTVEAALRLVANSGGVCLEYDFNSTLFAVRVGKLIKRKHCSDREVLNLIEDQLSQEETQMLNEMLKNSYLTKLKKIKISITFLEL